MRGAIAVAAAVASLLAAAGCSASAVRPSAAATRAKSPAGGGEAFTANSSTPADLTHFTVHSVVITSGDCRDIPITAHFTGRGLDIDVFSHVWRSIAAPQDLDFDNTDGYLDSAGQYEDTQSLFWCALATGMGTFHLGPSTVWWYDGRTGKQGKVSDLTGGTFSVKQGSALSLSASRSGSRVTLAVRATHYSIYSGRWVAWPGRAVTVQRLSPADHRWHAVATKKATSAGYATFRVDEPRSRYWRAVVSGTTDVWFHVSPVRRR